MRVVLRTRHGEVDVEVVVHDPAATVGDLAAALAPGLGGGATTVEVDGCSRPGSMPLADCGLRPGAEIAVGAAGPSKAATFRAAAPPQAAHPAEVRVVGGLAAGGRHRLALGPSVLGRDPSGQIVLGGRTTSRRHATVHVEPPGGVALADAGSTAGTWVDGRRIDGWVPLDPVATAALGSTLVQVTAPRRPEPAVLGRPGADGRRPLLRPPPPVPLPPPAPVTPPSVDPPRAEAPRFGWAAALVPLVGGLVLARLVDPRLALFTLLGPAVLAGQWIEDRRRHRRAGAGSRAAAQHGLASFRADLERAGATEARRRHSTAPDPVGLGEEIEALGAGLWSRRTGHPAFCLAGVGSAPGLRWDPPTSRPAEGPAASLLAEARLPHGCPVLVPLGPGHHLGVAGPREAALAVARWVLLQLAAHHGPSDLRLGVCAPGREDAWGWAAFLPHSTTSASSGRRLLGSAPADLAEVGALAAAETSAHVVLVVDADASTESDTPFARPGGGPSTIVVGTCRRALPSRCTSVLELDGPDGWGQVATEDAGPQALLATGVTAAAARGWARALAALADPDVHGGEAPVPTSVRLLDLLALDDPGPAQVRRRWEERADRGLAIPVGSTGGPDGPETVWVDLVADGPHALVAGTTGAGKSELLRSLVAGLAATSPPDRLALLLVDYKGGAAFAEAAQLPHVLGVVTDLGADDAARALRSLEAELRRREQVLSELGLRDIAAHPCHRGVPAGREVEPLPRVVVVVDELAALVTEVPSFLDGLVQLAGRGRSLGLHLVLGTQRPGGVVSAAVRANCALRCCLRVPDEADAVDVVGSAAPAHLDRTQAGRAFVRRGARDLVEVQVGLVGGSRAPGRAPVTVAPATFDPAPPGLAPAAAAGTSDLAGLVDACRAAAAESGLAPPRPLWLPPLPASLDGRTLPPAGDDVVLGLVDDPDHQRQLPLAWCPADGPLLAIGSGSGPAIALRAAARALAARLGPGQLHVYGFDLAGRGLGALDGLAHVGAIVRAGEHERLHRLVRRLADELAARQAAAAEASAGSGAVPLVLVLVNGVAALRTALEGTGALAALDALERVVADGAALGIVVAATADRPASVPAAWSAAASRRLVFRCGDPLDLLSVGAGRLDQSGWPEGRCLELPSALVAQVATGGWAEAAPGRMGEGCPGPAPVSALPARVSLADVLAGVRPATATTSLHLPLGIDGRDLGVASLRLRPGQPFVVCGPPGAGRSTALAVLRRAADAAGCAVAGPGPDLAGHLARTGDGEQRRLVVVVDDADRVDDPDGTLAALVAGRHLAAHVLAAVPLDALRSAFGHWTGDLRRTGSGLVLRPRSELDADVLGIPLLPRWPVALTGPGRGVLVVDGEAMPVQVATP